MIYSVLLLKRFFFFNKLLVYYVLKLQEAADSREFLCQRLILCAQGWELITKPECSVIRRPAPCFTGTTSSVKGLSELLRYTNFVSSVLAHSTESLYERYKSALYLLRGEVQWARMSQNKRCKENGGYYVTSWTKVQLTFWCFMRKVVIYHIILLINA